VLRLLLLGEKKKGRGDWRTTTKEMLTFVSKKEHAVPFAVKEEKRGKIFFHFLRKKKGTELFTGRGKGRNVKQHKEEKITPHKRKKKGTSTKEKKEGPRSLGVKAHCVEGGGGGALNFTFTGKGRRRSKFYGLKGQRSFKGGGKKKKFK